MEKNICTWCGSEKIVTSVTRCKRGEMEEIGWLCKKCYDKIPDHEKVMEYMFGHEGFIDDEKTVWD